MTERPAAGPRFGANYVPSRNWWHCWRDWDTGSILEDLRAVAGLGLDHVRIQLLWPVFQPDPTAVSPAALDHLGELLDLADRPDVGLDVSVTVLDGWLSGFVFAPAWLKGRNMITDDGVVTAELRLLDALAATIGGHPRFLGFDLGNELSVINGDVAPHDGDRWAARMLAHCDQLAPGRLHVNGHDHQPWFEARTFSPAGAATSGAASVFHTYPFWTGALERYGTDGTGTRHLGEYMTELVAAHASEPHRPRWLQEFGASPVERPADSIPDWTESLVRNTLSSADVWGCTWWGSHDIDRRFTGFHEYEYDLGLLTVDNEVKPTGERLRALVAEWRAAPPRPLRRRIALVLDHPHRAGLEFADHFFALVDEGIRPAIVTRDRATDADHLAARGIDHLVGR
ncbi:glycoside hydrolase 5 family protein [Micromonospora sp. BQ11]|uniref:glycoside hydrolase 5 family protein n=1 Tax=Micromonospora sp. BQ11 TaxID=3452212 RepID=UPI003F8AA9A0